MSPRKSISTKRSVAGLVALPLALATALSASVVQPAEAATARTVKAVADTFLSSSAAKVNYGTRTSAYVGTAAQPALVAFNTKGIVAPGQTVKNVALKVFGRENRKPAGTVIVKSAASNWAERTATYAKKPAVAAAQLNPNVTATAGRWVTIPLKATGLNNAGVTSYQLTYSLAAANFRFDTRETANDPQLVVTTAPTATTLAATLARRVVKPAPKPTPAPTTTTPKPAPAPTTSAPAPVAPAPAPTTSAPVAPAPAPTTSAPVTSAQLQRGQNSGVAMSGTALLFAAPAQRELDLDRLAASGAKWLRVDVAATQFTWDGPTQFHWAPLDEVVAGAEKRGLKVLGVIESLPVYDRPAGTTMWYGPKTDLERAAFARYATVAAKRYAGRINHWEVWNEPNLTWTWAPVPNAADYAKLMNVTYPAIKAANPNATVVTGGTGGAGGSNDIDAIKFLEQMYAAGGTKHDGVALHAYTAPWNNSMVVSSDASPRTAN